MELMDWHESYIDNTDKGYYNSLPAYGYHIMEYLASEPQ